MPSSSALQTTLQTGRQVLRSFSRRINGGWAGRRGRWADAHRRGERRQALFCPAKNRVCPCQLTQGRTVRTCLYTDAIISDRFRQEAKREKTRQKFGKNEIAMRRNDVSRKKVEPERAPLRGVIYSTRDEECRCREDCGNSWHSPARSRRRTRPESQSRRCRS